MRSTLGFNNVIEISFSQGNNVRNKHYNNKKSRYYHKKNLLPLEFVANAREFYEALSNLLVSIKNDIDVQIDIEMAKVNAENKKVDVLETLVNKASSSNQNSNSYIFELKELKGLLDDGVITLEEFNKKKSELLNK